MLLLLRAEYDGRGRCGYFTNDVIVMWSSEGITAAALAHYYETTLNAEGYSANAPPLLSIIVMWPCKGWETECLPASTPVLTTACHCHSVSECGEITNHPSHSCCGVGFKFRIRKLSLLKSFELHPKILLQKINSENSLPAQKVDNPCDNHFHLVSISIAIAKFEEKDRRWWWAEDMTGSAGAVSWPP